MKFDENESEYIERADYIETNQLIEWNVNNDFFSGIQRKLRGLGAKLLVGPRGCGKTHQMRLAYSSCIGSGSNPFPVFVSFSRYLRLEPYLRKDSSAATYFQTWVLCKIIVEAISSAEELQLTYNDLLPISVEEIQFFISQIEKGVSDSWQSEVISLVTLSSTIKIVENIAEKAKRTRTILLLDDAALTLTPEYMIEFFEVFQSLKTRKISPKASVYPGTTEYGPRFHVGHDAEAIPAWLSIEDPTYSKFMDSLTDIRFSDADQIPKPILELFKFASFGIPRAFIYLIRSFINSTENNIQKRFNNSIEERAELLKAEYLSIGTKISQYRSIIETGWLFITKCSELLKETNSKKLSTKQIYIGLEEGDDHKSKRMMKFLIEAGLLYELTSVKHGDGRTYLRYIPHLLYLIKNRTFSEGRGFKAESIVDKLNLSNEKHPLRRTIRTILGAEAVDSLKLDSPPCQNCGTYRLDEKQRFCHNCGAQLVEESIFEKCMQIRIEELPIPEYQKKRLLEDTSIRVIGDYFTSAAPSTELQKAKLIGPKRAPKIYEATEIFIEEFL